jgi:alginate O-acetyltransferase complex protein AlgI
MMRRGVWWRNLTLIVSMVLFGVWHKATVLFLLWGVYHGVLLVMHRQFQQLKKALNWEPPAALWTPLSWLATISLISLGWVFFRASSLQQLVQMGSAVFSPASYLSSVLSTSLYLLVAALAAGYATVLLVADVLENYSGEDEPASSHSAIIAGIARYRWYWIPPLYALALLVVLIVTHTQNSGAAQFMYRRF